MRKCDLLLTNNYYNGVPGLINLLEKPLWLVNTHDHPYHISKYRVEDFRFMKFGEDNYACYLTLSPLDAVMCLHNEGDTDVSVEALGKYVFTTFDEANKCRHQILRGKQISFKL